MSSEDMSSEGQRPEESLACIPDAVVSGTFIPSLGIQLSNQA